MRVYETDKLRMVRMKMGHNKGSVIKIDTG